MARNGTGTFAKINTFVAGASITAAGHNQNWDDLVSEMTNSVAADGQTTITGALKGANGSVSAPAYGFASDPNTGAYRIGADNYGIAVGGTKIVDVASTGITITGTLSATGTLGATGDFAVNTNKFNVTAASGDTTVAGTLGVTGAATFTAGIQFGNGTVSLPSVTFASDLDCGLYRIGANNIGLAANGAKVLDVATTGLAVTGTLSATSTVTASNGLTVSAGTVTITPAATVNGMLTVTNAAGITAVNTVKAWARITWSGGVPAVTEGFNVASVADTGTGDCTLTFTNALSTATYAAVATAHSTGVDLCRVHTATTTTVRIQIFNAGGTLGDPVAISVIVMGA